MPYPVNIPGFETRQIAVESGFFSGPKLLIDGQPAPKAAKARDYVLRRSDGSEVKVQLRGIWVDPIPQIMVDGKPIQVTEPLQWYQWVWAGRPLALIFVGGLLGGLMGGLAITINGRLFRSELNGLAKYLLTGLVSVGALVGYFILAILFNLLIRGQ